MIDANGAQRIHEEALGFLENPGIRLEHAEIVDRLLRAGCRAGAGADVVRMPAEFVTEQLAQCPETVLLADRRHGGKCIGAGTPETAIWSVPGMYLHEEGRRRPFTADDMARAARLLEGLDQVDGVFGLSLHDVPPPLRDVEGVRIIAANTRKHVRALCFTPEGCETLTAMKPVLGDRPWFSVGFTAHGPLRWTRLALDVFLRSAGHGIPVTVNGEPMAGVSGPVTLAGAAAVGTAEILAGIAVNQLLEPGRPCLFNLGLAHVFDMRTAIAVTGGPENALLAEISAAMGRFYKLPSASWVSTESMNPDAQAALEKMFGFTTHLAAGISNVWAAGQLESELTFSPAQAVIDNEMIAYVRRHARGVAINDDTLARATVRAVGIGGSYLGEDHTLDHFREEIFMPTLLCRQTRDNWAAAGAHRLDEKAERLANEAMARPYETELDQDQIDELARLTERHRRRVLDGAA